MHSYIHDIVTKIRLIMNRKLSTFICWVCLFDYLKIFIIFNQEEVLSMPVCKEASVFRRAKSVEYAKYLFENQVKCSSNILLNLIFLWLHNWALLLINYQDDSSLSIASQISCCDNYSFVMKEIFCTEKTVDWFFL